MKLTCTVAFSILSVFITTALFSKVSNETSGFNLVEKATSFKKSGTSAKDWMLESSRLRKKIKKNDPTTRRYKKDALKDIGNMVQTRPMKKGGALALVANEKTAEDKDTQYSTPPDTIVDKIGTSLKTSSVRSKTVQSIVCKSITGEIVVHSCEANVTAVPFSQTISPGSTTNISFTSSIPGTTFKWGVESSGVSGAVAGNGNTIAQTLTKTGTTAGLVVYTVTPTLGTCSGRPVIVVVNVESSYTNSIKSGTFIRDNCENGGRGATVIYTVAANTYSSTISQAEADALAQNDVDKNGQKYANTNGTCSYLFGNVPKGDFFTNETCGGNQVPEIVSYNVQANTYFAATQAEADQMAQDDVYANGQNYANTQGGCGG